MGYDLHIMRRKDWSESQHDITAGEWLAYIDKAELSPLCDGHEFSGFAGLERYWWTSANMSRQTAISDLRPHLKPQTKLSTSMTQAQFDNGYWYATELKEFAKTVGIPSTSRLRKDGTIRRLVAGSPTVTARNLSTHPESLDCAELSSCGHHDWPVMPVRKNSCDAAIHHH